MDPIKEAFTRIKEDILLLKKEISSIKSTLNTLTQNHSISFQEKGDSDTHTDTQTQNNLLEPSKTKNIHFSTGNEGVPTDRQTDRQTNRQTQNPTHISDFSKANEVLESLDSIKKEIRLKFKRLTPQEMVVFSNLYTLEEGDIPEITYRTLSSNLNLTESSIRDYINRLIKKGIPIEKIKQNNKTILLKISKDLKNIVTLSKILQLRDL